MTFLVDTSVVFADLRTFAEACAKGGHEVHIPALVYAERVFQLRREKGSGFDPFAIRAWFERLPDTLRVQTYDQEVGDLCAERLFTRFPTDETWDQAKGRVRNLDLFIASLGTPETPVVTKDTREEWHNWADGAILPFNEAMKRVGAS